MSQPRHQQPSEKKNAKLGNFYIYDCIRIINKNKLLLYIFFN